MLVRFFVDRPVFATVLSLVIVIIGGVALTALPVAQYPEVTPPTVSITAVYPGANAKVVAETVAAPIEQEVNGVENMLYMQSRASNDGSLAIDVVFKVGTNVDQAQVLVQNRVAISEPKLPEDVRRQGVVVKKKSPSILLAVNLISPDQSRDQLFLSNYATTQIKDSLARLDGVGDVSFLAARDYSMRIWLDPDRLAALGLSAGDVMSALREQNVQVSAGRIGQAPVPSGQETELVVNTQGRLIEAEEFADVIVKYGDKGQTVRVRDIARTELGAKNYDVNSYLDGTPAVLMAVFQLPGSNALDTAQGVRKKMDELSATFPQGVEHRIVYDTTIFVEESIHEVYKTLFEAFVLVFLVVLLFLQDWRATLMPMIDVPVSLIGTFAVMAMLGFSLNNLSLFGLVLAIGIVVDDAIVVVENIERWLHQGLPIREATIKAMDEIIGPVIAITLVLSSVFIPTAFIAGISGEFYRQFALTIASATIISAINALTMAPARAAQIFKPNKDGHQVREPLPRWGNALLLAGLAYYLFGGSGGGEHGAGEHGGGGFHITPIQVGLVVGGLVAGWFLHGVINGTLGVFFKGFNAVFDRASKFYGAFVGRMLRVGLIVLLVYGGLMYMTFRGFQTTPVGFIPEQDKGYFVVNAQLPDGASLERTEAVMTRVRKIIEETPGVKHTLSIPGYSILTSSNLSNMGGMFVILDSFHDRAGKPELGARAILGGLRKKLGGIREAVVVAFGAPPVDGLGSTGGFKLWVQDKAGEGPESLQRATDGFMAAASAQPGLVGLFSSYRASQPQLFVEIDRTKVKSLGLSLQAVNEALQTYLGSAYANDFSRFGRNWQVNVQADGSFRADAASITRLQIRNGEGKMLPLGSVVTVRETTGPATVYRFNMYPAADVSGGTLPGYSSGQAVSVMEQLGKTELPSSAGFEWTELTLLQLLAGNTAVFVFLLGTVLVFLVLAAQYESWSLPLAVILIVPMCLLAAITGVQIAGSDNNIFTQIGLVVLIGLAAKNAILIVEFAKQRQGEGLTRREAVVDACTVRLRPILMTSAAFILGVLPLLLGKGAGAEMRQALGLAVFSGMLGVTFFGLLFTPVFYDLVIWWFGDSTEGTAGHPVGAPTGAAHGASTTPTPPGTV
jgi:multidrug efflux pump